MRLEDGTMYITVNNFVDGGPHEVEIGPFELAQTDNETLAREWLISLEDAMAQPFCQPGHRNSAAVNVSCIMRALGIEEPWDKVKEIDVKLDDTFLRSEWWYPAERAFLRVEDYLDNWDDGDGGVLDYVLD